ncbi:helix-turn-helix transcriptional regulator [soil metagenome]
MPVRVRLDEVLISRRMALAELADRVGLSEEALRLLRAGGAKAVRLSTLDALCRELDCQPAELLTWSPFEEVET